MSLREVGAGKPYATIQAALDALFVAVGAVAFTETHTIRVFNGTYNETATPNTLLNPTSVFRLVIEGATGNTPIVDGQSIRNYCIYIGGIDYTTVSGMTVRNGTTCGIQGGASLGFIAFGNTGTNCLYGVLNINNCPASLVYNNNASLCTSWGLAYVTSPNSIIRNNTVFSNGTGIFISTTSTGCTVYGNTVYSNGDGIYYNQSGNGICYGNICYLNTGAGIMTYFSNNCKVYNNIVYMNSYGMRIYTCTGQGTYNNTCYMNSYGIMIVASAANATVKNNIIWGFSTTYCIMVDNTSQVGFVSDRNNFYAIFTMPVGFWVVALKTLALWKTATGQDANSVSARTNFVSVIDTLINNLAITDYSPCVGVAEDLSAIFTTDFNGVTRTVPWDMGAYVKSAVYIPIITNQQLSNYAPTQDQIISASCNVAGTPDHVVVKISGKSFVMTLAAGTLYSVVIPAYLIGQCTAQTVLFMATNFWGGSDEVAAPTITIPVMTNYNIALMETNIVSILSTITDLKTVLAYEPREIPELPALTLYFDGYDQTQTEAVSFTVTYKWIMRLYVRLLDAKTAQDDVKSLTKQILSKLKLFLNLNEMVLLSYTPSAAVSVMLEKNNPVMLVEFNFTAMREEN